MTATNVSKTRAGLLAVLVVAATAAVVQVRTEAGPTMLSVAGRANATPSVAAHDRFVVVAWGATLPEGGTDVYAAVSRDGGAVFGAPVRVNHIAADAKLNGEQPPHVVLAARATGDPVITVVWTSKHAAGTVLLRAQSTNGGRTFTQAATVPGTDAAGNRGWESVAVDRAGRVGVTWLDHREVAPKPAAAPAATPAVSGAAPAAPMDHSAHVGSGVESAQRSKLYFGFADGRVPPTAITGGVCYCCKTAMATGQDGAIYMAWRHVYPGDMRDMAFVASHDGGKTFSAPVRVSEDGWSVNGCPENGPSLAVGVNGAVHIAWPTKVEGAAAPLALFYAVTNDGRSFTPRRRISTTGTPAHVQLITETQGGLALAWDEVINGQRRIMMSRATVGAGPTDFAAPTLLTPASTGAYPDIAAVPGAVVVVWTATGSAPSTIHVQRIAR